MDIHSTPIYLVFQKCYIHLAIFLLYIIKNILLIKDLIGSPDLLSISSPQIVVKKDRYEVMLWICQCFPVFTVVVVVVNTHLIIFFVLMISCLLMENSLKAFPNLLVQVIYESIYI